MARSQVPVASRTSGARRRPPLLPRVGRVAARARGEEVRRRHDEPLGQGDARAPPRSASAFWTKRVRSPLRRGRPNTPRLPRQLRSARAAVCTPIHFGARPPSLAKPRPSFPRVLTPTPPPRSPTAGRSAVPPRLPTPVSISASVAIPPLNTSPASTSRTPPAVRRPRARCPTPHHSREHHQAGSRKPTPAPRPPPTTGHTA